MNKQEFAKIAMAIRNIYPKESLLDTDAARETWYSLLRDLEYGPTVLAIQKLAQTTSFSPSIAEIRTATAEIDLGPVPDYGQAWEEVMRVIKRYGYYRADQALEALTPLTRTVVKRIGFEEICTTEEIDTIRAQFRRIYEAEARREEQTRQQSRELLKAIEERREEVQRIDGESSRKAISDSEV
jgi:hypothetical protein